MSGNKSVEIVSGYMQAENVKLEIEGSKVVDVIRLHDQHVLEVVQPGGEVDIAQNQQIDGKDKWGLPEGGRICGQAFVVKRSQPPLFELVVLNRINSSSQKFFNLPLTVTEVKKAGPEDMGKPGVASVLMFRLLDNDQWWGVVFKNQQQLSDVHAVIKRITSNFTIQSTRDAQYRPWNSQQQQAKQRGEDMGFFDPCQGWEESAGNGNGAFIDASELEGQILQNSAQVPLNQLKSMLQDKSNTAPPIKDERPVDDLLADLVVKTTPRQQQQQPISNRALENELIKSSEKIPQNKAKDSTFAQLLNGWSLQNSIKSSDQNKREQRARIKTAFLRLLEREEFLDMLAEELVNI